MRLSDYKNEEALEVLEKVIEPASEIFSDKEIAKIFKSEQPKIKIVNAILKNHKKSIIAILAALENKEPEEYTGNLIKITKQVLDLLNDEDLIEVFTYQSQTKEQESSGSV